MHFSVNAYGEWSMPLYYYSALNAEGRTHKSYWFGDSKVFLYKHLKDQNLHLISCRVIKKSGRKTILFKKNVNLDSLYDFCLHLEEMLRIKITLNEAISLYVKGCRNRVFREALLLINNSLQQGLLFSQACELYPNIFDNIFLESIKISERTGDFNHGFKMLQNYFFKKKEYSQKMKEAIRYPFILLSSLLLLVILMGGIFLPQLTVHLQDFDNFSPSLATTSLIDSVDFFKKYGIHILLWLAILGGGVYYLCKFSKTFDFLFQKLFFKLPVIGSLRKIILVNRFFQSLGLLLHSNIELLIGLKKSINSVENIFLKKQLNLVLNDLQKGQKLSQTLENRNICSPFVLRYIELGEETGNLGFLIQQAVDLDLRQIWQRLQSVLSYAEPILLILMGSILVWVVLAAIVPVYDALSFFEG